MFRVRFLVDSATRWGMKRAGEEFDCPSAGQVQAWKDRKLVEVISTIQASPAENPQAHLNLASALEGLEQVPTDQPLPEAFKAGKEIKNPTSKKGK